MAGQPVTHLLMWLHEDRAPMSYSSLSLLQQPSQTNKNWCHSANTPKYCRYSKSVTLQKALGEIKVYQLNTWSLLGKVLAEEYKTKRDISEEHRESGDGTHLTHCCHTHVNFSQQQQEDWRTSMLTRCGYMWACLQPAHRWDSRD